ncbi:replication protein A 70 kDa DNA-binding subunit B-like isoform X3 [Coffea arabica]|uniref:Replication protein A 70 kDa DNA-binding subunit B-like isoform X3 n=1 Tax=Coffea arabica TaxID=13443 RepID=A0A6P6VIQ1_COFAR
MDNRCTPISDLTEKSHDWMIKIIVMEKSNIFPAKDQGSLFQRFMFANEKNETIQAIAFNRDVSHADNKLQLYHAYYIGNASISPITDARNQAGSLPYQLTVTKATFIKAATNAKEIQFEDHFPITSFWQLDKYKNSDVDRFNILCAIIQGFPETIIPTARGPRTIRRFVAVNPECRPMIFTMWEPFVYIEGIQLMNMIHTNPVILIIRPKITAFHAIDITTRPNTTIVLDPPLQQAATMKIWIDENRSYIHKVINEKLYEKDKQQPVPPLQTQIRPISQIISSTPQMKHFWIKGMPLIVNLNQRFFSPTCPTCNKSTGALMDVEFDCNFCDSKNKIPRPKAKVQLNITDDTGFLSITAEDRHAETLLGFTGSEIYERYLKQDPIPIQRINEELQRQTLLCEVRSYWPPQRQYTPLYFLTAFIPEESAGETLSDQLAQTTPPTLLTGPTSALSNTAEETVSDTNVTEIPASSTSLLAEMSSSVKHNLEPDFSQVTKHQKLD